MFQQLIFILSISLLCISSQVQSSRFSLILGLDRDQDVNDISSIKGENLRKEYNELNRYLIGKTNSESVQQNIELVLELYNKHLPKKSVSRSKTLQAEKLFLSLRNLKDTRSCSKSGKVILEENESALKQTPQNYYDDDLFYLGSTGDERRRIDDIYSEYLKDHVKLCQPEYLTKFNFKFSNTEKEKIQKVADICDQSIAEYVPNKLMPEVDRLFNLVRYDREPSVDVYRHLLKILDGTPDYKYLNCQRDHTFKKIFDVAGFERVFDTYILEPCENFIRLFGPDIFEPAMFELEHLKRSDKDLEFYQNMARYRVCKTITDYPDTFYETIEMIVGPYEDGLTGLD